MIASMTGFATKSGQGSGAQWVWDVRSVNSKGLDLRLRLPDWIDGFEPLVRTEVGKWVQRGSVSLTLRITRDADAEPLHINPSALDGVLAALRMVSDAAAMQGLVLEPPTASDVLAFRGVIDQAAPDDAETGPLRTALLVDLQGLMADFVVSRKAEGAELIKVLTGQVNLISSLAADAETEARARASATAAALRENLARVLANADGADETRVAQELAMLAVKSDVTEELHRLSAHVSAARNMLSEKAAVGRKLDFLMQEFNREANTLCSKAQSIALTRIGLDLKTVIDQMREQVQNVE